MFVGGCVRKFLTNENIDDIDIASIFSPEEIKEKFKNSEFKIIDTGIEHGSVTVVINSSKFEITTLRKILKQTEGMQKFHLLDRLAARFRTKRFHYQCNLYGQKRKNIRSTKW